MNRSAYFLYGEQLSGIIKSQALDVVRFIDQIDDASCKLISFLPFRNPQDTHLKLERELGDEIPFIRGLPQRVWSKFLKFESIRLRKYVRSGKIDTIICRNAFACLIALETRDRFCKNLRVCFDGRGALVAEQEEYNVYPPYLVKLLREAEERSVLESDFRIAVSVPLVEYWKDKYSYKDQDHVVIPTTISESLLDISALRKSRIKSRSELKLKEDNILIIYSGSTAGWQGFDLIFPLIKQILKDSNKFHFLFLTKAHEMIEDLMEQYPEKINRMFVDASKVESWLAAGDYGLLIREKSITNNVASPTKYAEYLKAGLMVITNNTTSALGGESSIKCEVFSDQSIPVQELTVRTQEEIEELSKYAIREYSKTRFNLEYRKIIHKR